MKNLLLALILLFSHPTLALDQKYILKTELLKDGIKKVHVDINLDGIADRIETYKGEQLIAIENDTKKNGNFDEWIMYSAFESVDKPIQVTKKDTNGDGKIDRIESVYKDLLHKLLITSVEIDSKYTGKFDVKYSNSTELNQKKDEINCAAERSFVDDKLLKLSSQVDDANKLNAGGYIITEKGYKVHKSCMDRWGAEGFPKLLKTSMDKGMQCLADLAQKNASANATPNGAKINLENLKYLQQNLGAII